MHPKRLMLRRFLQSPPRLLNRDPEDGALSPFCGLRVETIESRQGATSEVTALKAEVTDLRKYVDYLKSTNFSSLLEAADDVDALTTSEIPPNNTRDVHMDDITANGLEIEIDE
uniref:Polyprotein protein n=1 Tax=Solanum tuberosum TaxID=4113 RepID=M1DHK5_SOLTU